MTQIDTSKQNGETPTPAKEVPITSYVSPWLTPLVYPLGRYIVLPFYFGHIKVNGREHLPSTGPVILAPTHRSRWDALIVPYAAGADITGRDLRFMVSNNEIKGLQGWAIKRFGGFPVDPEQPGISSLRHSLELLINNEIVVIFPEGNIFRDNGIHPLKRGLARLALQAESSQAKLGVKIVPMSIRYSQPVPHWGCDVKVDIGSPLQVAKYAIKSAKQSAIQLTADLETALKELHEAKV
ncbi:MAG: 1-acyl-sn-glycerol-3-phosphate acyltransferase [Chamaesiphon sp.]